MRLVYVGFACVLLGPPLALLAEGNLRYMGAVLMSVGAVLAVVGELCHEGALQLKKADPPAAGEATALKRAGRLPQSSNPRQEPASRAVPAGSHAGSRRFGIMRAGEDSSSDAGDMATVPVTAGESRPSRRPRPK